MDMKRLHRGFTLIQLIIVVAILSIVGGVYVGLDRNAEYTIRYGSSNLVLHASGFKPEIAKKAANDGTLASSGRGLTVTTGGEVSGGSVTNAGMITVAGNATSVGTALTLILTPSLGAVHRVAWACSTGSSTQWKYFPPECHH
jgi:prepilin-type N-terminal cleavage/methylation domain-containing protein